LGGEPFGEFAIVLVMRELLTEEHGDQQRGGEGDGSREARCAARRIDGQRDHHGFLAFGQALHQALGEALGGVDGPQCAAQLVLEIFGHGRSSQSTSFAPIIFARSAVSDRLMWLFTVFTGMSSIAPISARSRSSW